MKKKNEKQQKKVIQSLTLLLQFGLNMIVPIFMCTMFGVWLGKRYHMTWICVPFFLIGAIAGFNSIYKMAEKIYGFGREDRKKDVKKIK